MTPEKNNNARTFGLLRIITQEDKFDSEWKSSSRVQHIKAFMDWKNRFRLYKVCWPDDKIIIFDGIKLPRLEQMILDQQGIEWRIAKAQEQELIHLEHFT